MLAYFGGFWQAWNSGHKVQFDPINKLILINEGITEIDVKVDLYSDMKEWMLFTETNNRKLPPSIQAIGGQPISATAALGSTFFLVEGWRIKPWVGHTNIAITGNLYVAEGGRPIVPDDNGNDSVSFFVSSLVDTVIVDAGASSLTAKEIWEYATRTLTSAGAGGATAQEVWEYANRSLTDTDVNIVSVNSILVNNLDDFKADDALIAKIDNEINTLVVAKLDTILADLAAGLTSSVNGKLII